MPKTAWIAALLMGLTLAACGGSDPSGAPQPPTDPRDPGNPGDPGAPGASYDARITRTELGIPHIVADDIGSVGYGYGYAFAEDNLCVLLQDLLTIRGERARHFGREGSYTIGAAGVTLGNVNSDFFWKLVANEETIGELQASANDDVAQATTGYRAGLNRYIAELEAGEHPGRHAACRDAEWLQPVTEADMYRRYYRLAIIASATQLGNEIANATPPLLSPGSGMSEAEAAAAIKRSDITADDLPIGRELPIGSNMYGLGPDATANGQSMLFGNPHFPWTGPERLYIAHLTIPGEMDIMGASLYGIPAILIGFNDQFAWSHTVSTAYRFGIFQLAVNPLNPMRYFYDGEQRDIEPVPLEIEVQESDGSITTESRTLYRSHFGPIMELEAGGIPVLGWDNTRAYTIRDANGENDRLLEQFFAWNQAESLDDFKRLQREIVGVPWVNTVATGPGQNVYYSDTTVVPNVPDELVDECRPTLLGPVVDSLVPGLPFLHGNSEDCNWRTDEDAPAAGIFGPSNLPSLERSDWVHNCNDSHWLTNPEEPLTGFARVIGAEETERSLRTRLCIRQVQDRLDGSDGRPGNRFDFETLKEVVLSSQLMSERLAREAVLSDLCDDATEPTCTVLESWDGTANRDARGAHIWREFWREAGSASNLWETPFNPADPVNTPRDLNTGSRAVANALSTAQQRITDLGIALDAPLGSLQASGVNDADGAPIPIPGGEQFVGAFTIANTDDAGLTESGYAVDYGNSYIQAVTWEDGAVRAEGFVTYSQSTDPASPHYSDFTQAYSDKDWHAFAFTREEIGARAIRDYRVSQ